MVNWIGKFSLLLRRSRDAWLDMLPQSTVSEERRQNQYLADVNQENEERQRRIADVLDLDAPETQGQLVCHTGEHPRNSSFHSATI